MPSFSRFQPTAAHKPGEQTCLPMRISSLSRFGSRSGRARGLRRGGAIRSTGRRRPRPALPPPERTLIPTVNVATAQGWPRGRVPRPHRASRSRRSRAGWIIRAGCWCCPTATCWWRRAMPRPSPKTPRASRLSSPSCLMKKRRRRRRQRQPDHLAARRRWRRRGRDPQRLSAGAELTIRHGAGGQRAVRRQLGRDRAGALPGWPDRDHAAPVKVTDLPAGPINHHWTKNIIASPDGSKLYATVGSNSNVGRERHGRRGRPRRDLGGGPREPAPSACSPRACAIRTAWAGSRRPARCGRW